MRFILSVFTALLIVSSVAYAALITPLLTSVTTTGAGASNVIDPTRSTPSPTATQVRSFTATLNGASAISATVAVDMSNDCTNWVPAVVSITLPRSSDSSTTDGAVSTSTYQCMRGNLKAISGVGASVTLISVQ